MKSRRKSENTLRQMQENTKTETHATLVSQRAHLIFFNTSQADHRSKNMLVSVKSKLSILLIYNFLVQYFEFKANIK